MTSLPKLVLGAFTLVALSLGLSSPAQAYGGHRGGVSISFGDPYSGVYLQVPIGHRYHHRRHYGHYPYYYGSGYGYYPYTYYPPRHRLRHHWRDRHWRDYRWRDRHWRDDRRHWRRHRDHRWH